MHPPATAPSPLQYQHPSKRTIGQAALPGMLEYSLMPPTQGRLSLRLTVIELPGAVEGGWRVAARPVCFLCCSKETESTDVRMCSLHLGFMTQL